MNHKKLILLSCIAFSILFCISSVSAESDIDISAIPQSLADKMGIPLLASQLLCVAIIFCITLLPSLILTRNKKSQEYVVLFMGLIACGITMALGWLPLWFLVIICLVVASLWASHITDWTTRGRE